ncbi:MAG TPA: dihydropteroate synthase [Prevotella sp.]|nr:dihydropteroate synthase [Prevotella sp.]
MNYTLNIRGHLLSLKTPLVMGIMNVTPDSFYAGSRAMSDDDIAQRAKTLVGEGATIVDIGGCSTRPGGAIATEAEEADRVRRGLEIVKAATPDAIVSIDTFRASVARMAIEEFGADIINDVSGGEDPQMFPLTASTGTPYILMSQQATLRGMLIEFAQRVEQLRALHQKDIILDPGFGFGKTRADNFRILDEMDKLQVLELPVLAAMSRKRMVFETLGGTPAEALNGTTVVNTMALMRGASIIRVHDVKPAVEAVKLYNALCSSNLA